MKEKIGKRIEKARIEMKMTKEEFARMLGVSGQYLGIVERGKSCLSYEKLKVFCNVTGLSADYVLFGRDAKLLEKTQKELNKITDKGLEDVCELLGKLAVFVKQI